MPDLKVRLKGNRQDLAYLICLFPAFVVGQADTSLIINEVEISAAKIKKELIGGNNQTWKTAEIQTLPANNIAELLNNESGVFIKNYGAGSLSTSSIRGGSGSQTLVLWNGLPLQSPMLGLLDLSLLPINSVEEVSLEMGGNSALWGSGAIGGVIKMDNQANFNNVFTFSNSTKIGSFGLLQEHLKFGFGNKKFQSVTKLSHQKAENKFKYLIAPDLPKRQQTNAQFSEQDLLQDLYWKINKRNQIAVHFWQQFSNKHIPPLTTQTRSVAEQDDLATRVILNWRKISDGSVLQAKVGFFNEQNNYFDEERLTEARNHFRRWMGELEREWHWDDQHQLLLGITHSYTQAFSDGYLFSPSENRSAMFASYKLEIQKLQFQTSLRQEFIDGKSAPLVPNIGLNYDLFSFLKIKFKISKNFRSPTLNDRFWVQVGNVDLLAENGWSEEMTLDLFSNNKNTKTNFSLTGFNRKITNWLSWGKLEGQTLWSPLNFAKVWSRGLEQRFSFFYKKNNTTFQLHQGYDLVRSTHLKASENPRFAVGEQLWYTPEHQAFMKFSLGWNDLKLSYQHQLIGKTLGINENVDAYHLGNANAQYFFKLKNWKSIVFFNVNNIWNTSYYIVERRPMAGINYQLGLNINFFKNNN